MKKPLYKEIKSEGKTEDDTREKSQEEMAWKLVENSEKRKLVGCK